MPAELTRVLPFFLILLATGVPAAEPDPNYRKLRDAQPEESYQVKDLVLRRDLGVITLRSGTISFTPAVLGRVYAEFEGRLIMAGRATLRGNSTVNLNFQIPQKPKRLLVNGNYDVLARK